MNKNRNKTYSYDVFEYKKIQKLSDDDICKKAKEIQDIGKAFVAFGTECKQIAFAYVYVYFSRKVTDETYKKDSEGVAIKFAGSEEDNNFLRRKQKLRRALIVMYENDVAPEDALVFIKKHTLKNLYNGNLADEKNASSSKKKHQQANTSNSSDPLTRIMEKENVASKSFVIVRYRNKTSYLTDKQNIKEIFQSYDFSSFGENGD